MTTLRHVLSQGVQEEPDGDSEEADGPRGQSRGIHLQGRTLVQNYSNL